MNEAMQAFTREWPQPTLAEAIAFLQTLPPDMICTERRIICAPVIISIGAVPTPWDHFHGEVEFVELRLARPIVPQP